MVCNTFESYYDRTTIRTEDDKVGALSLMVLFILLNIPVLGNVTEILGKCVILKEELK